MTEYDLRKAVIDGNGYEVKEIIDGGVSANTSFVSGVVNCFIWALFCV